LNQTKNRTVLLEEERVMAERNPRLKFGLVAGVAEKCRQNDKLWISKGRVKNKMSSKKKEVQRNLRTNGN